MWGIDAFSDPNATAKEMGEKVWTRISHLDHKIGQTERRFFM